MTENRFDGKKILLSEKEWKEKLTPFQYKILREKGTEPPYTNKYYYHMEDGIYCCSACNLPLFSSKDKYDSGSGWPSFTKPLYQQNLIQELDKSHAMIRIEIKCARCSGHLGHVFNDGPRPSNKRYCINSSALTFKNLT